MMSLKTSLHLLTAAELIIIDYEISHCKSNKLVYFTAALTMGTEVLALVTKKPIKQKD